MRTSLNPEQQQVREWTLAPGLCHPLCSDEAHPHLESLLPEESSLESGIQCSFPGFAAD